MTRRVFSSYSEGNRYYPGAPNESDWVLLNNDARFIYNLMPKLIYAHERNNDAKGTAKSPPNAQLITLLAEYGFASIVPDLGGTLWGNPSSNVFMNYAHNYITAGQGGKVNLLGLSHGGLSVLNWARLYPDRVNAIALIQPALSLADLKVVEGGVLANEINVAYLTGGGYSDVDDGPTSSPVIYAEDMDQDIPICIWSSADGFDTVTRSGPVNEFLEKRPSTKWINLGPLPHGLQAVINSRQEVLEFFLANR